VSSRQTADVIDKVERILGLKDIQWPSLDSRLTLIRVKLDQYIEEILRLHGFVQLLVSKC
jgi:hypothetical protein